MSHKWTYKIEGSKCGFKVRLCCDGIIGLSLDDFYSSKQDVREAINVLRDKWNMEIEEETVYGEGIKSMNPFELLNGLSSLKENMFKNAGRVPKYLYGHPETIKIIEDVFLKTGHVNYASVFKQGLEPTQDQILGMVIKRKSEIEVGIIYARITVADIEDVKTHEEFSEWVRENDPAHAWTLGLEEHPGNYDGPCHCDLCLSYD